MKISNSGRPWVSLATDIYVYEKLRRNVTVKHSTTMHLTLKVTRCFPFFCWKHNIRCTKVSALTPNISEYFEAIKMNPFSGKKCGIEVKRRNGIVGREERERRQKTYCSNKSNDMPADFDLWRGAGDEILFSIVGTMRNLGCNSSSSSSSSGSSSSRHKTSDTSNKWNAFDLYSNQNRIFCVFPDFLF